MSLAVGLGSLASSAVGVVGTLDTAAGEGRIWFADKYELLERTKRFDAGTAPDDDAALESIVIITARCEPTGDVIGGGAAGGVSDVV
jgi:hypothetical protein